MFRASQTIALSFPSLFFAAIASTSAVSANEIKKVVESNPSLSTSVNLDDVINVSGNGLQSPVYLQQQELTSTAVPVTELSNLNVNLSSQNSNFAEVTSVSQLNDVKSTDWAFTALQSLVERYGTIAGYPDSTFRGKQVLTRYEFAAGLNTALDKVNEIISSGLADKVSKEDLATIQKLQEDFAAELATLRGRVDSLDEKVVKLESQQFSPRTKLSGSASFLVGAVTSKGMKTNGTARDINTLLAYAANLRFNTSFTGKDLLSLNISANNAPALPGATGTFLSSFAFDSFSASVPRNTFGLGQLFYRFPVGDQGTVWLSALGLQPFDYFPVISPLREGVSVPNSRYGLFNPGIFRPGFTDTGIGAAYRFSDQLQLHAGYFASESQANVGRSGGFGLFGGSSTIAAQLTFKPSDQFISSLNYIRKYFTGLDGTTATSGQVSLQGGTGTNFASDPFNNQPTTTDTFGGQFDWRIFPKIGFGGWFSTTSANNLRNGNKATVLNGALSLGFYDLFKEGNHGGLLVAIPPYVSSNDNAARKDVNIPWQIEAFYTYKINKNISITPDIYVILNPDGGSPEPIWAFTLRTTFLF